MSTGGSGYVRDVAVAIFSLHDLCLGDLSNGGRGIRNQLEARLLNPLSRALFDQDAQPGERFLISALDADGLTLERR